jgi:hypothetical protein
MSSVGNGRCWCCGIFLQVRAALVSFGVSWLGSAKNADSGLRERNRIGMVQRERFHEVPPRAEYSLTSFGVSLREARKRLCEWGSRHTKQIGGMKAEREQAVCLAER